MKRTFLNQEGESNKLWTVEISGASYTVIIKRWEQKMKTCIQSFRLKPIATKKAGGHKSIILS
jgi:hypothetical protein